MKKLLLIITWCTLTCSICFAQYLLVKPTRTISFTTDEGTYMDVDVSPDGKTLLFGLLGDLYTVPVTGGKAKQLTRGIVLKLHPKWSPDGKKIAFMSDTSGSFHISIMDLKRTFNTVLDRSANPMNYPSTGVPPDDYLLWTPDGNHIIAGETIYGLGGGKLETDMNAKRPIRFSADGKIVYSLDAKTLRIYYYDTGNRSKQAISPTLSYTQKRGILSPDGRWWCYIPDTSSARCLVALDLKENKSHVLVNSLIRQEPRYNQDVPFPHYSFSANSKTLYIGYGGKIHGITLENGENYIIPFTADVKVDLGLLNYHTFRVSQDPIRVNYTRSANASPDGKRVVFTALDKLYVMDLPHGKPHELCPQPINQFQPAWSPDGKWIAYVSWCDTIGGQLWRVSTNGGVPQQLTTIPGQYQHPVWSPDGSRIAFIKGGPYIGNPHPENYAIGLGEPKLGDRDDTGIGRLELISVQNGTVRAIDDSLPLLNNLVFSADGQRIIYTPKLKIAGGRAPLYPQQLVSRDLTGENQHVIAIGSKLTEYVQKTISPDGRYLVYSAAEDLYLLPLTNIKEPALISDPAQKLPVIKFAAGVDPYWEKGGKVLAWSDGNRFYRSDPDKILAAAERIAYEDDLPLPHNLEAIYQYHYFTAKIKPDETIDLSFSTPAFYGKGVVILKNARIITMQGNKVIEQGTIIIRDGRIIALGRANTIPVPKNAKIIDLKGKTIMPGLIDLHDHMRVPPNIFPQQSWMFLANLAYGVTTARDPAASYDSFGYAELLQTGQMTGPRLYTVGRPVRGLDGILRMDSLGDAKEVVRKRKAMGSTYIKSYMLGGTRMQREWLNIAANTARLNLTNEGYDPISYWAMIKDGNTGIEHNAQWGDVYKDVVTFIARSGTFFTPTLQVTSGPEQGSNTAPGKEYFKFKYWHEPDEKLRRFTISDPKMGPQSNAGESVEVMMKGSPKDTINPTFINTSRIDAQIRKAGGKVTLGSHGNDEGIGAHNELWALQMGGLTNMEALQAATILAAQALGLQKDLGSIESGKIADLIILNKNPLNDIHNSREIKYVMKDGVLYNGDTLDEIWPKFKKCSEWKLKNK